MYEATGKLPLMQRPTTAGAPIVAVQVKGRLKAPVMLFDGGFILDTRVQSGITFSIPYSRVNRSSSKFSRAAFAQVFYALEQCYDASEKVCIRQPWGNCTYSPDPTKPSRVMSKVMSKNGVLWARPQGKGVAFPYYKGDPGRSKDFGFTIPNNRILYKSLVDGSQPFVKFKHPRDAGTNRRWGIYLKIAGGKFHFTFRVVPMGFWGHLWNSIRNIPHRLVEFVKDVYDFLMTLGCPLARGYLLTLKDASEGKQLGPAETAALTAATGIPPQAISELQKDPSIGATKAMANTVIDMVCGPPPTGQGVPIPRAGRSTTWILLGLAAAAVGIYYVTQKG